MSPDMQTIALRTCSDRTVENEIKAQADDQMMFRSQFQELALHSLGTVADAYQSVGQNSPDFLRKRLRLALEARLKEKNSSIESDQILKAAQCIEQLLYKQLKQGGGGGVQGYDDITKLNERLAQLLLRLKRRKRDHVLATAMQKQEQRRKALIQSMGSEETYKKALQLANEIQRLRLQHASKGCCGGGCSQSNNNNSCAPMRGRLPGPAQKMFFNVHLMPAMHSTNENKVSQISKEQWQVWIAEAECILENFKEWRQLQGYES